MTIKAGTIIQFSCGYYSDYSVLPPLRVLKDFDKKTSVEAFKKAHPNLSHSPPFEFVAWLSKLRYVEDVENVHEWHLGDYELEEV